MKYKIHISLLILLGFANLSCDEDSFSQVVTIDIPAHESALAVKALFQQSETELEVFLANSLGIIDKTDFDLQQDALVELFEDGQLIQTFQYDPARLSFIAKLDNGFGKAGASYRIQLSAEQYPIAQAIQAMPAAVPLISGQLKPGGAISEDGERVDAIELEFQDPIGEENYYGISATEKFTYFDGVDSVSYRSSTYLDSNDPLISFAGDGILIVSDKAFNGKKYKLLLYTYENSTADGITIQFLSMTKDMFLYYRSLDDYYEAKDNPFAEPVNVHSNIESGHGIFGVASQVEIKLE
ncbi:MAG: DUF4249 domain-containing protein [Saprospiraceae bacterium]|nr:DUF4249 domain-containing protein [Saprospiraceae bacterium]